MRRTILALLSLAILALAQFSASVPASAACGDGASTCFWIGSGTNWSATGSWSATSGGASSGTVPATGDSIIFDTNSAAKASTLDAGFTATVKNVDFTGYTGTLTHAAVTLNVSGTTFTLASGMTYTLTSASTSLINFTSTSGTTTITPNGIVMGPLTFNGVGGTFSLGGDLTTCGEYSGGTSFGACIVTLTNGTFTANNHNLKVGAFASNNSNTRVVTMGSGTWTLGCNATSWNFATTTGLTLNFNTAPIVLNCGSFLANGTTFAGGGLSYTNTVTFGPLPIGGDILVSGSNTFATLALSAPVNVQLTFNTTQTITNAINWAGSSTSQIGILSSNAVAKGTLAVASGSVLSWAAIQGIAFTGTTATATNSFDLKNNSGVTITAPSTGGGGGIIGGYLLRRDLSPASNDNNPVGLQAAA